MRDALNGTKGFDLVYILVPLVNLFKGELSKSADDKKKAEYVYGVPFSCRPEERETNTTETQVQPKMKMKMSGAVKSITNNRSCIKIEDCIHFQIHFDHFDIDEELQSGGSNLHDEEQQLQTASCKTGTETETKSLVPVIDTDNYDDKKIAIKLAKALQYSFDQLMNPDADDNEGHQKKAISDCLQPMLQFGGYDYKINGEDPDFEFIHKQTSDAKKKNGVIMCGEVKEVFWDMDISSTVEELSALTEVCMDWKNG